MTLTLNDSSLVKRQSYIDGLWVDADSGDTLAVTNPANNETLVEVAKCGTAETRRMIEAAEVAQRAWAKTTLEKIGPVEGWLPSWIEANPEYDIMQDFYDYEIEQDKDKLRESNPQLDLFPKAA